MFAGSESRFYQTKLAVKPVKTTVAGDQSHRVTWKATRAATPPPDPTSTSLCVAMNFTAPKIDSLEALVHKLSSEIVIDANGTIRKGFFCSELEEISSFNVEYKDLVIGEDLTGMLLKVA